MFSAAATRQFRPTDAELFDCQVIVDPPADGCWNMALDEALLESAEAEGRVYLRFYQWREPTLSLGYFQSYSDRTSHATSADCKIVRRATGGGAILHHHELTYSIALPQAHPLARQAEDLYLAVHQSLVDTLAMLGIQARCRETTNDFTIPTAPAAAEPFLCFQRATVGDVVVPAQSGASANAYTFKVGGSAQRRRQCAVLQHGSILLKKSPFAPELPGIVDLSGTNLSSDQLLETWPNRLAKTLQLMATSSSSVLSDDILTTAGQIRAAKFAHLDWTKKR
ncbi:MAG TPA: lipoate--protein ligase family protein [Pirellulales bacterium]|jgi:lipoate-protein ligase A